MIRAAVDGVVDFSKSRLMDPNWHRHVAMMLGGYYDNLKINFKKYAEERHLKMMMLFPLALSEERYKYHSEEEFQAHSDYFDLLFGNTVKPQGQIVATVNDQLKAAWESEWGSMNDPKTIQRVVDTAAAIASRRAKVEEKV
jgi:hypothetical protein